MALIISSLLIATSVHATVVHERLTDRLTSSHRVDEAMNYCNQLLGVRIRTNQISLNSFQACVLEYVKELASQLDDIELIYPKTFN
ncbi:hypothetical protein ACTXT7_008762 [Hymenolepis weldensis]